MKSKILFLLILQISLFAGYTQDKSVSTVGNNSYDNGATEILKLESSISGTNYTVTVSKKDGGKFSTDGNIFIKVGSPEPHGVDRHSANILAGESSKTFTHDMNKFPDYPKKFYARYESANDGWIWVGPITVSQFLPSSPTITILNSATIDESVTVRVKKGTIGDNNKLKIQCTASNSNRDDNTPFVSSWTDGGDDVSVSFVFSKVGEQTIYCTTFDEDGLASGVKSATISVKEKTTVETPPVETPPVENNTTVPDDNSPVENNETVVDENIENNTTIEPVGEKTIDGFRDWFTPYRCFDSIAPDLDLVVENDTKDNSNNRILDLEFYVSGGSQSCVDTDGVTHQLDVGTRWYAKGLEFEDLTSTDSKIKYKRVRVTVPDGVATEIRLAVITTLGKLIVKSVIVDKNGNVSLSKTITYGLNGLEVKDKNILSKIKLVVEELKSIKLDVNALFQITRKKKKEDDLGKRFDAIKHRLDDAKKLLDKVKKEIDKKNEDKKALEKEIDKIKKAIDSVKKLIDKYKKDGDNSAEAIETINNEIDGVIAMMVTKTSTSEDKDTKLVLKGWNTISGNINLVSLPDTIRVVWIVDGGYLKGYSADKKLRDEISKRYELIETETLGSHKGIWIYAYEDTEIELIDNEPSNMKHVFWKGYSIHGANNKYISFINDDICKDGLKLIASGKLTADKLSVYVPEKVIDGFENFIDIEQNEAYYILCDDK